MLLSSRNQEIIISNESIAAMFVRVVRSFSVIKPLGIRKRYWAILLLLIAVFFMVAPNIWIASKSDYTYTDAHSVPRKKVGLLLGTSKNLRNGRINYYYRYRIKAAVELFQAGRIRYILISGDNGSKNYNEPVMMMNDLVSQGIPQNRIYLDFAGFRTLDSMVRCKEVFHEDDIVVISQQFHNERAISIAHWLGMKAIGYNAKDIKGRGGRFVRIREKLARIKVLIDIIFGVDPKYLGTPITIK